MNDEENLLRETLRTFRQKDIEPQWEHLDRPNTQRFSSLWNKLDELGLTACGLPEQHGGLPLSAGSRLLIMRELGRACPSLAVALLNHTAAQRMLGTVGAPPTMVASKRLTFIGNPLDDTPAATFSLLPTPRGDFVLHGLCRTMWPEPELLCIPVFHEQRPSLCLLPVDAAGVTLSPAPSCHGLCLLEFGELSVKGAVLTGAQILPLTRAHHTAREADGLLAGILSGIAEELLEQAGHYALERYQGGKMIHQHDAVRQLVGPIEVNRRAMDALALSTLVQDGPADGATSAFAVELVRQAGLDAIQTLGGYGYMEDYRVERYLRDANTLETMWIHADARRRQVAAACFAKMAS